MTRGLEQLARGWKRGDLPPLYTFLGADPFSHRKGMDRLRAELAARAGVSTEEVELLRFSGKEVRPDAVLEALTDVSLFSRVKLVAVSEVQALPTEAWRQLGASLKAHYGTPHPAPPSSPLLVLTSSEPNMRRDRGPSRLGEMPKRVNGAVRIEFPPPTPHELPTVLTKMAEGIGASLSLAAARHLTARVGGTDLQHYENELGKLLSYAHPGTQIEESMIDAVASRAANEVSPYLIFDLAGLIVGGRLAQVMATVKQLLAQGETPLGILAMLARHIRQLRRATELGRSDTDAGALAKEVGVPPFVAKKLLAEARQMVPERLDDALMLCAKADVELKRTTETIPLFEAMMCRVTLLFARDV